MSAFCDTLTCSRYTTNLACACTRRVCDTCKPSHKCEPVAHGTVLGSARGIHSYHNNHKLRNENDDDYDHLNYVRDASGRLQCSGDKWQPLEYARRWWIIHLDVYLPNVLCPSELFERNFVKRLSDNARVDLQHHEGATAKSVPIPNDLIIWKDSEARPTGHVAVVVESTETYVRIAEQCADHAKWNETWSRQLPVVRGSDGVVVVGEEKDEALGWVRVLPDKVLPPMPWKAPSDDRTAVDGDYGAGTIGILQTFLGMTVDGKHGRLTDYALAAFLNTHVAEWPHVVVAPDDKEPDRTKLIVKLQHFLNQHPLISGVGHEGLEIKEDGVWDASTTKGVQNLINRVTHADEFIEAAHVYKSGGGPPPRPNLPHGFVLGEPKLGVPAYNCNYQNIVPPEPSEAPFDMLAYCKDARGNDQYSGMKWQCVEYARRWWIVHFDVTLLNIPRACDIWTRTYAKRLSDAKNVALEMFGSGVSQEPPKVGDLIIWKKTAEQPVGHVAVVCEVEEGVVRIAEQNVDNNIKWDTHFSREFPLQRNESTGAYILRDDEDPLFGWVRVHPDRVVNTTPWAPPATETFPVDGVMSPEVTTAWQKFVGVDVKRDLGDVDLSEGSRWADILSRMTDYALAAFLNVAHQKYPHVYMASFMSHQREEIIKKLQNFLNSYPELTGAGPNGLLIEENGEWGESTTRAVQQLLNKLEHYEDFEAAVALFCAPKQQ